MSSGTGTESVVKGLEAALDGQPLSQAWLREPGLIIDPAALRELERRRPGATAKIREIQSSAPPHRNGDQPEPRESRYRLIPAAEMENLPKPEWLIEERLTRGGLSVLAGPPGCGKTFLALSDACSVAEEQAPAIYIAAEGSSGLGSRIRAWKTANHAAGYLPVHFITEPVSLLNAADLAHFLSAISELGVLPALITIDTLARCMIGGDENSTQDMSAFIAGADSLRRATGAHVQLLHHFNAGGERERGNTALRGACDTMMFLTAEGADLTLTCQKQKDAPPFPKQYFRLASFGDSAAAISAKDALHLRASVQGPLFTESHLELLALVQTHFTEKHGPTATEWWQATGWAESKRRTFWNYRKLLVTQGYVNEPERERGGRYTLTDLGKAALGAKVQDE